MPLLLVRREAARPAGVCVPDWRTGHHWQFGRRRAGHSQGILNAWETARTRTALSAPADQRSQSRGRMGRWRGVRLGRQHALPVPPAKRHSRAAHPPLLGRLLRTISTMVNSAFIPVVPNDTEVREYSYPVGLEDGWTREDRKAAAGTPLRRRSGGEILLGGPGHRSPRAEGVDLRRRTDSWSAVRGVRGMERRDGRLIIEVEPGTTATILQEDTAPTSSPIPANGRRSPCSTGSDSRSATAKWSCRSAEPVGFHEWFALQEEMASRSTRAPRRTVFPLGSCAWAHRRWRGHINRFGLEFAPSSRGGKVEITRIAIVR